MPSELAPVISLDAARARAEERLSTEIQQLTARLGMLRDVIIEPPDSLLPAILAQLDEAGRPRWIPVSSSHRWVAAAGGIAAGAIVLVGRSAWSHLAS